MFVVGEGRKEPDKFVRPVLPEIASAVRTPHSASLPALAGARLTQRDLRINETYINLTQFSFGLRLKAQSDCIDMARPCCSDKPAGREQQHCCCSFAVAAVAVAATSSPSPCSTTSSSGPTSREQRQSASPPQASRAPRPSAWTRSTAFYSLLVTQGGVCCSLHSLKQCFSRTLIKKKTLENTSNRIPGRVCSCSCAASCCHRRRYRCRSRG